MNIFEVLKSDHKKVAEILDQLEKTTERGVKTRETLFAALKEELELHAEFEEEHFYPVLKEEKKTEEITLEGYEEHKVIHTLLQELEELSVDHETWGPKLKVLKENVEHHVEEEEGEMFKKARSILSAEQQEELGAMLQQFKQERQPVQ